MSKDIRWLQRFDSFQRALLRLDQAVELYLQRELSLLEKQGVIQSFEFTHELAWKTLKDFFIARGNAQIYGSKDATREAFSAGIVEDGQVFMDMIVSRNRSSHTYDEVTANQIFDAIINRYHKAFHLLEDSLAELAERE